MSENSQEYEYLEQLNPQQRAAVEYTDGPSLVIAGAGSGKTRVLTYKIVHLLHLGYQPWRIMALTFTNKAAREMKERVAAVAGSEIAARIPMGTFHSLFLRILRCHADRIGYRNSFSIYDQSDSRNLVKMIVKELGLSEKEYKPATVSAIVSNAKNALLSAEEYERRYYGADVKARRPLISRIFAIYNERCRVANAMDFDDIILNMHRLLSENEDIRCIYNERYRYILVDEYQDTNFAQHCVVMLLMGNEKHLCVVGDDAQSIYSFRGANINNIIGLEKTIPGLRTFRLERNYRSTQNIVNAAGSLIDRNTHQLRKHVFSENEEGSKIEVIRCYSDLEEASIIAAAINRSSLSNHDSYDDYAILYRTNAQSRVLEEALRKRSMPYRIFGATAFYQRKEVKDALSYFRVAVNPDDDEALRRIINYPARGIGETTMKKVQAVATAAGKSLWGVISDPTAASLDVSKRTLSLLDDFCAMMQEFIDNAGRLDAFEMGQDIYNRTGILAVLESDRTPESISRKENLNELLAGMRQFVDMHNAAGDDDVSLSAFLSEVMLATDQDQKEETVGPKVTMMTAHAAKGLEFRHVYIVGVEEELFPSAMSMDKIEQVEEERRLLYVAMTRAMKSCTLSYARSRFRNGMTTPVRPSRFLMDIDPRYLDMETSDIGGRETEFAVPAFIRNAGKPVTQSVSRIKSGSGLQSKKPAAYTSADPHGFIIHSVNEVRVNMTIEHSKFGSGRIVEIGNVSGQDSIVVDFGSLGIKKLLLQFAKFKIQ